MESSKDGSPEKIQENAKRMERPSLKYISFQWCFWTKLSMRLVSITSSQEAPSRRTKTAPSRAWIVSRMSLERKHQPSNSRHAFKWWSRNCRHFNPSTRQDCSSRDMHWIYRKLGVQRESNGIGLEVHRTWTACFGGRKMLKQYRWLTFRISDGLRGELSLPEACAVSQHSQRPRKCFCVISRFGH